MTPTPKNSCEHDQGAYYVCGSRVTQKSIQPTCPFCEPETQQDFNQLMKNATKEAIRNLTSDDSENKLNQSICEETIRAMRKSETQHAGKEVEPREIARKIFNQASDHRYASGYNFQDMQDLIIGAIEAEKNKTEKWERRYKELAGLHDTLQSRLADLESKIQNIKQAGSNFKDIAEKAVTRIEAVKKFVRHLNNCNSQMQVSEIEEERMCDCGLTAALEGV